MPPAFPAVADWRIVAALHAAALAEPGATVETLGTGLALSEGVFYPGLLPSELPLWIAAGVLAIEMECSLLFTLAALRGVRAGALLNVDNYVPERTEYQPHRDVVAAGTERMIRTALRAVPALGAHHVHLSARHPATRPQRGGAEPGDLGEHAQRRAPLARHLQTFAHHRNQPAGHLDADLQQEETLPHHSAEDAQHWNPGLCVANRRRGHRHPGLNVPNRLPQHGNPGFCVAIRHLQHRNLGLYGANRRSGHRNPGRSDAIRHPGDRGRDLCVAPGRRDGRKPCFCAAEAHLSLT